MTPPAPHGPTPDYGNYSSAELEDVLERLDRTQYPERHALAMAALQNLRDLPPSPTPPARVWHAVVWLRVCAVCEVVGGLAALGPLFTEQRSLYLPFTAYGVLPVALIAAGVLLWRRAPAGGVLSALLLLAHVPTYISPAITYQPYSALNFQLHSVYLNTDRSLKCVIGVNVVALAFLIALCSQYQYWRRREEEDTPATATPEPPLPAAPLPAPRETTPPERNS